MESENSKLKR
jgi:hypothetical protein